MYNCDMMQALVLFVTQRDGIAVDWRFTTSDARIKLKSLYPIIA